MRVNIGPFLNWWGPYQIANLLQKIGFKEEFTEKLGVKLADIKCLSNFCEFVYAKRKRHVSVKLHKYDTWNMDGTLAIIILPMLKQLKATKHGSPFVANEDVPERLWGPATPNEFGDVDAKWHERWEWVLNEMIWAFEQKQPDCDWESAFHHGVMDWNLDNHTIAYGDKHTHTFDYEGYTKYRDKIKNGLRLFGVYYEGLWH